MNKTVIDKDFFFFFARSSNRSKSAREKACYDL